MPYFCPTYSKMGAEYRCWEHRIVTLRLSVSWWIWMFKEQTPWKRAGPVWQSSGALKRITSIENWMRANYSTGRSDVLLEDGWVKARGFKLITSHIDLKCKCTSTLYMVSNVCTFCILQHCLKKMYSKCTDSFGIWPIGWCRDVMGSRPLHTAK